MHTYGSDSFDLGRITARLHCENLYAPYRQGHELRERVLSILLRDSSDDSIAAVSTPHYQLAMS
jgi:hypothetical protein